MCVNGGWVLDGWLAVCGGERRREKGRDAATYLAISWVATTPPNRPPPAASKALRRRRSTLNEHRLHGGWVVGGGVWRSGCLFWGLV